MIMKAVVSRYEELPQIFERKYGVKEPRFEELSMVVESIFNAKVSVDLRLSIRLRITSK